MTTAYDGPALLHAGYIKTGTTYLQQTVFDDPALGFERVGGAQNRALLVGWFRARNDYDFDATALSAEMRALEAPIRAAGRIPVWSEETLLGDPLVRAYCGPDVLRQLAQLDLSFKVLITIRKQEGFALSGYREALRFGRYRLRDFVGTGAEDLSMRPILRPEFLEYDTAIAAYQAQFGADQCCVLPLEDLSADPLAYVATLCGFVGLAAPDQIDAAPRNPGRGGTALAAARVLNGLYTVSPLTFQPSRMRRLVGKVLGGINRLAPAALDTRIETRWRAQIAAAYAGQFADSNRRVETLTGLDLKARGYQ